MKTTLNTKTYLFHIIISIVVAGLLFSVNLSMAEDSSTSPSNEIEKKEILKKKEPAEKKEIQEKKKIYEKNKMIKEKKLTEEKMLMEKKEDTSDSKIKNLIDSLPDGCILIVEHPEFPGENSAPSKGLVIKSLNPREVNVAAKNVTVNKKKNETIYEGDVTITMNDSVINTEEAVAISKDQKLIIKIKSAKIKKLRS